MQSFNNQDQQKVNDESMIQAPIFSFLEGKVQKRFNDATRAQVERKLKLEQAKRKEVSKNEYHKKNSLVNAEAPIEVELVNQKVVDDEYVLYQIQIKKGSQQWTFRTRFSLLHNLNEKLSNSVRKNLAAFPEKRFFGNLESEFLARRYVKLESYLKSLFQDKQATKLDIFQDFLKQSRLGAVSINDPASINNFRLDY